MGVYTRFKRDKGGFRKLVELLESTPKSRRQRMIDVGMEEDPAYTERALALMLTFEDVLQLPDLELAELIACTPQVRTLAYALSPLPPEVQERFLKNAKPPKVFELRDLLEMEVTPQEVGGAQLKLVEIARSLERRGILKIKRIPE